MLPVFGNKRMGIVFRQSVKNSVVTLTGAVLGALIIVLSTRFLSKREYGAIGNLTNYAVTGAHVMLLGINYTLAVYIHRYANDERRRRLLLSWCIILPGVLWALGSMVYVLLRTWVLGHFQPEDQPFMDRYFLWMPAYILLFVYMIVFEQYLGSQMKVAVSAFMREVVLRIATIVLMLLFIYGFIGFDALVRGTILVYFIPVCVLVLLAMRNGFAVSGKFGDFSRTEYKELFHFTWYHFLFTISAMLIASMDALLLPLYDHKGFSAAASYRVVVFLISLLQVPNKAMLAASFPALAKAFAENDREKAADFFLRSSVNIFIATVGMSLILCCNLYNVVLVVGSEYADVGAVFLILFAGNIINIATGMNDQVLTIANYYKLNFYLSLGLIAVLYGLLRMLVPAYGVYGAAWSTSITLIVFNTVKLIFVWKKLDMVPFSRNTVWVVVAALPALAAGWFLPHVFSTQRHIYVNAFADACLRSALVIVVYFLMLLWLKPSKDMVEYLANVRKNKRLF